MAWPETVTVVTADDMCIGPFKSGNCGCIAYWIDEIFCGETNDDEVYDTADEAAVELGLSAAITYCSDIGKVSRKTAARVVNRTTARLGYVLNNPECDSKGNLRPIE